MSEMQPQVTISSGLLKTLADIARDSALDVAARVVVEAIDGSPRLRELFLRKNFQRWSERGRSGWEIGEVDACLPEPSVSTCTNPACLVCAPASFTSGVN
jgi:hypothetical protein